MRWAAASVAVAAMLSAAPALGSAPTRSATGVVAGSPIIAVLDSGVRVTHREFDYRGPRARNDQIVAWWDFTTDKETAAVLPRPGQVWDARIPDPYDDIGHGTAVAAMAVGLNRTSTKTPSAAPGFRLAVGKVSGNMGAGENLAAAIEWAVHTVHASVINMSIGSIVPSPAALDADVLDAIDDAWRSGTLVVVANGNGWGNIGLVPGQPGWASEYGMSTHVLTVGESDAQGVLDDTDPELTAQGNVRSAASTSDAAYADEGGSSFASPFVAGFAARLVAEARRAGRVLTPDRLRQLVEYSAVDTLRPPQSEGYGELSLARLPAALVHAREGTLPGRPNPDPTGWYVENVSMRLRDLWSNELRG